MQVSICLGAILIPEYLDSIPAIQALKSRKARIFSKNILLFQINLKRMHP